MQTERDNIWYEVSIPNLTYSNAYEIGTLESVHMVNTGMYQVIFKPRNGTRDIPLIVYSDKTNIWYNGTQYTGDAGFDQLGYILEKQRISKLLEKL